MELRKILHLDSRISFRLYLAFGLLIVLLIGLGIYMKETIATINNQLINITRHNIPSVRLIHSIHTLTYNYRTHKFDRISATTIEEVKTAERKMKEIKQQIEIKFYEYSKSVKSKKERELFNRVKTGWNDYLLAHEKVMESSKTMKMVRVREIMLDEAMGSFEQVSNSLEELIKYDENHASKASKYANDLYKKSIHNLYMTVFIIFVLALLIADISIKNIVSPVNIIQEELEYNKSKVEFIANLSHELKTPLTLIFSSLKLLDIHDKNNLTTKVYQKSEKYKRIIKQNSYRLLKLVNNIVDITKIESNSFDINLENYDIINLTRKITNSVADYMEEKNRKLKFNSAIDKKIIVCDPFNLERVFLNLFSNAVKFTKGGDEISVNIYERQEEVVISVKDTGVGIPKEKQKLIFERFGQADKSFTRNHEGSGIGLSIVKLLIELQGGNIKVESNYGEGSKFIITLPVNTFSREDSIQDNYSFSEDRIIERIDVEFSDI